MSTTPRVLILRNHLSPGDVLIMSGAIHSLHRKFPGQYLTAVDTSADELYEYNPDVISRSQAQEMKGEEVQMHYPLVNECNQRPVHVLQGYSEFLGHALGITLPLVFNRPLVYLSMEERQWMPQVQEVMKRHVRYWIVNAGVKNDYTAKQWPWFQKVVDLLQGQVFFVQVGSAEHIHPPLKGVLNLVGKTSIRQLVRLTWHADGVLSGVSFPMHLAAACMKPAVIVAGAREPRSWNTYPQQALISTVGMLGCARDAACWRSRTVALGDGEEHDKSLCEQPTFTDPVSPKCMAMITEEEVVQQILKFHP